MNETDSNIFSGICDHMTSTPLQTASTTPSTTTELKIDDLASRVKYDTMYSSDVFDRDNYKINVRSSWQVSAKGW